MFEQITVEYVFQFMLIFARLATALTRFPAIGSYYIFARAKLLLSLMVTLIMMPVLTPYLPKYGTHIVNLSYFVFEILIGFIISIAANIYFLSVHFVGQVISMQSGLGAAAFFDPNQRSQVALLSNFVLLVTITMIFATNTHHIFIHAIADSYIKFPPGEWIDSGDLSKFVSFVISDSFLLSFKIVSPFLVISVAVMLGSSLLARLMPNFQVFFVITPIQILIMLSTLYVVVPTMIAKIVQSIQGSVL